MHQETPEGNNSERNIHQELNEALFKALDKYVPKERDREKILHNPLMVVSTYGLDQGCSIQEVVGSLVTAALEVMYLDMITKQMEHGEDDDGEEI